MFPCAIAPLDQSTTSLGWSPGAYLRDPCGLPPCGWNDHALQFFADPGTPVVAPFPVRVISTSPFIVRGIVDLPFLDAPADIHITGIAPAVAAGASVDLGGLLGRVARGQRGVGWELWGTNALGIADSQPFIDALFRGLGLEIVGAATPDPPPAGFRLTPRYGGKLLARVGGPAACTAGAMHGIPVVTYARLEALFLNGGYGGGLASVPPGFVEPSSAPYARFGQSKQTDTSRPAPRAPSNLSVERAGGLFAFGTVIGAVLGAAWWATR